MRKGWFFFAGILVGFLVNEVAGLLSWTYLRWRIQSEGRELLAQINAERQS